MVYRIHTNPTSTSIKDRSFIQKYDSCPPAGLIPGKVLYVGEPTNCMNLLSGLYNGEFTPEDVLAAFEADWDVNKEDGHENL